MKITDPDTPYPGYDYNVSEDSEDHGIDLENLSSILSNDQQRQAQGEDLVENIELNPERNIDFEKKGNNIIMKELCGKPKIIVDCLIIWKNKLFINFSVELLTNLTTC